MSWKTVNVLMSPTASVNTSGVACGQDLKYDYAIALSVICGVLCFLGICYLIAGYRYLKATFFLTGFIFGSLLSYLICIHEQFLPPAGNVGVAVSAGVVCGLICMLILLVGYFLTGFFTGFVLAIVVLVIMHQYSVPEHRWLTFGLLAACGLVMALFNLKFQKAFTVLGTSVFGAVLVIAGVDYFAEMFLLILYLWSRIRNEPPRVDSTGDSSGTRSFGLADNMRYFDGIPCWHTLVMMCAFPVLTVIGVLVQACFSAKDVVHKERFGICQRRRHRPRRGDIGGTEVGVPVFDEAPREERQRPALESRVTAADNGKIFTSVVPGSGSVYGGSLGRTDNSIGTTSSVQLRRGIRPGEGFRNSAIAGSPDPSMKYCHLYQMRRMGGDVPSQSAMKDFRQTRQSALLARYSDSSDEA